MRTILFIILILAGRNGFAQNQADSSWSKEARISLSGFADVFYVYDFNQPESIERQTFFYLITIATTS